MLADLSKCARKIITDEQYLLKYVPNNKISNYNLDYEGFILYRQMNDGIEYSKIKTDEYYKSHLLKITNIPYLIELANTAGNIFKLSVYVKDCFINFNGILQEISKNIMDILINQQDKLYQMLPEKTKPAFSKQNDEAKYKMLINLSSSWNQICFDVFCQYFKKLSESKYSIQNIYTTLKKIILKIMPWDQNYIDNIKNMVSNVDISLKELFIYSNNFLLN